jgi:hypothetical protein
MRKNASLFLFVLMLLTLSGMGLAAIAGPGGGPSGPPAALPSGINTDVPFSIGTICGFQIVVTGEKPVNFYTGSRNPWGAPTVIEVPPGSHVWVVTYGGSSGPCFSRNDPRFWQDGIVGGTFLGLHFGFYTNDPIVNLIGSGSVNATCWLIGPGGTVVVGPPLTGHTVSGWIINVQNANAQGVALANAQLAVVPSEIPINSLTRSDLDRLSWQDVQLESNAVPGGSNEHPGTLPISLPLAGQKGWAVFSYSVLDAKSGDASSTVTLEFPIP